MRIEQSVYVVLEPGAYQARLISVEEKDGNWGSFVKLGFEVDEPDYEGVNVTGAASAHFSSRSKLYRWTRALLGGREIPTSYTWDSNDLISRRCILSLDVTEDENGARFNRVADVLPVRQRPVQTGQRAKVAAPVAAPAPEDEVLPEQDEAPWPSEPPADLEEVDAIPW